MKKYSKIDYTEVELPEELLTSFAKALGQHRINAKIRIIQWVSNKNCG